MYPSAEVWRGPDSDALVVEERRVTVHAELLGADHAAQPVVVEELVDLVLAEEAPVAVLDRLKVVDVLLRNGPHERRPRIAERHLNEPVELVDLVQLLYRFVNAAGEAEELVADLRGERERVERVHQRFPRARAAVRVDDLLVQPADEREAARLVRAAQQIDVVGVLHRERKEEADSGDVAVAVVDEVAEEEVRRVRDSAADIEELVDVVELRVDAPNDGHWLGN